MLITTITTPVKPKASNSSRVSCRGEGVARFSRANVRRVSLSRSKPSWSQALACLPLESSFSCLPVESRLQPVFVRGVRLQPVGSLKSGLHRRDSSPYARPTTLTRRALLLPDVVSGPPLRIRSSSPMQTGIHPAGEREVADTDGPIGSLDRHADLDIPADRASDLDGVGPFRIKLEGHRRGGFQRRGRPRLPPACLRTTAAPWSVPGPPPRAVRHPHQFADYRHASAKDGDRQDTPTGTARGRETRALEYGLEAARTG